MTASTRDRILAEAQVQLLERGYAAFTVAGVRDALGLSSGSMFHAFGSKAALAAAVHVEGMTGYQQVAGAALGGEALGGEADPERALRALVTAHLGWVEDHRALARWLFTSLPDEVAALARPALAAPNAAFFTRLADLYRRWGLPADPADDGFPLVHAVAIGPTQEYCRQWTRGTVSRPPSTLGPALADAAVAAVEAVRPHL